MNKPTQPTSERGYVVVSPSGKIERLTFASNRKDCIAFMFRNTWKPWKSLYRRGWRVKVAKMEVQQ